MDRRVAILRFWLLCLASLAVAVCWPEAGIGLWPVAFLFPSCVCCPAVTDCEDICSDGSTSVSLTVAGIANEVCANCNALNATYVTDIYSVLGGGTTCSFSKVFVTNPATGTCSGTTSVINETMTLQLRPIAGNGNIRTTMVIRSAIVGGPNNQSARWAETTFADGKDIGTAPLDCAGLSTVTLVNVDDFDGGAGDECDASASTCDVDFL